MNFLDLGYLSRIDNSNRSKDSLLEGYVSHIQLNGNRSTLTLEVADHDTRIVQSYRMCVVGDRFLIKKSIWVGEVITFDDLIWSNLDDFRLVENYLDKKHLNKPQIRFPLIFGDFVVGKKFKNARQKINLVGSERYFVPRAGYKMIPSRLGGYSLGWEALSILEKLGGSPVGIDTTGFSKSSLLMYCYRMFVMDKVILCLYRTFRFIRGRYIPYIRRFLFNKGKSVSLKRLHMRDLGTSCSSVFSYLDLYFLEAWLEDESGLSELEYLLLWVLLDLQGKEFKEELNEGYPSFALSPSFSGDLRKKKDFFLPVAVKP